MATSHWRSTTAARLALLGALLFAGCRPLQAVEIVRIDSAEFAVQATLAPRPPPTEGWKPVELPDVWRGRLARYPAVGWYRLRVESRPVPDSVYALRFARLSSTHRVFVNGALVQSEGQDARSARIIQAWPRTVVIPAALLRPGGNEIDVEVCHGAWTPAQLSMAEFGPASDIVPAFERARFWSKTLPEDLNLLAAVGAVLLLMVWLRRRSESGLGAIGGLVLVRSMAGWIYYAERPLMLGAWTLNGPLLFASQVWSCALVGAFAVGVTRSRLPAYRRLLVGMSLLLPAADVALTVFRPSLLGRFLVAGDVVAFGSAAFAVGLLIRLAIRSRERGIAATASCFAIGFVAFLHDLWKLWSTPSQVEANWLPIVLPLLVIAFAFVLVEGILRGMREAQAVSAQLERHVRTRTEELAAANAAKTRVLAVASHDLRQPLHAISLLVGVLRERVLAADDRRLVDKVQRSVDGMGDLLKGLLDISRLDAGAVKVEPADVAVDELFESIRTVEAPVAESKGLKLRIAHCSAWVRTDRTLAQSVLRNLVANATRYTERGSVLLGARRRGARLAIQVHDTGIGIAPEHQARIFDEFYQVKAGGQGLGLGLSIARRTCALLGHTLALRSTAGAGSVFEVLMPLAAPRRPPLRPCEPTDAALSGSFVVLLENDTDVSDALESLLHAWGCHVLVADRAATAVAALQSHVRAPDLLLCDYRLADKLDGIEAIGRIREAVGDPVPALLITGDVVLRDPGLRLPGLPVLLKPVSADALRAAMVSLLRPQSVEG